MTAYTRHLTAALFIFTLLFAFTVLAAEKRVIELKDGSVISGEIVSFSGGVYSIKSDSLGNIKIQDSKVRTIRAATPGGSGGRSERAQVDAIGQKMMADEEIMKMVLSLQNDPDFQAILNDPSIMQAIESGNLDVLTANPKFLKLMEKSKVKDITKKVIK